MKEQIDSARELLTPRNGWLAIGAYVVAHDVLCKDGNTLSEGFDKALERPFMKFAALGGTAFIAAHLCNFIPDGRDPLGLALKWKHKANEIADDLL